MCTTCHPIASSNDDLSSPAGAFAADLLEKLNHASLSLMLSIGHRTHLFDAMQGMGWVTSGELAGKAGLNERYIREWLAAMATGRVVEVDGSG